MSFEMLRWLTAALTVATYGAFAVGAYIIFGRAQSEPRWFAVVKLGTVATAGLTVATLLSADTGAAPRLALASMVFVASLALFLWAGFTARRTRLPLIFSDEAPPQVLTAGPYRYLHHPFYTSYCAAYVASMIACPVWWVVAPAAAMICLYVVAARREAAKLSRHPTLGAAYGQYRGRRTCT